MTVSIGISVESDLWRGFDAPESLAETAIGETLRQSGAEIPLNPEVSVLLCDDAFMTDLNTQWRGIAKPTNVLSFPAHDATAPMLGDIVVAFETSEREARAEGKSLHDHVAHLFVHGCLHLLGYDHLVDTEADAMENLERSILAALGIADPYMSGMVETVDR